MSSRSLLAFILLATAASLISTCAAFVPSNSFRDRAITSAPASASAKISRHHMISTVSFAPNFGSISLNAIPPQILMNTVDVLNVNNNGDGTVILASSSIILSETEAWVQPLSFVLGPFLTFFSFAMLCRIVLSWYPSANVKEFPFSVVVWPTEPLLRLLRGSVPPAFGVDITPVVWLGLFSFMNEIFLGQQGLLTMKMKYGI